MDYNQDIVILWKVSGDFLRQEKLDDYYTLMGRLFTLCKAYYDKHPSEVIPYYIEQGWLEP